jgi:hypothetical protein
MRHELPERVSNAFTDRLWNLLLQCWRLNPHERPAAREVLTSLQELQHARYDIQASS